MARLQKPSLMTNSLSEAFGIWFQASSIDGIGHAGRARNPLTRAIWALIFLVGSCVTVFHLYWVLLEYYMFEVRSTVLLSPDTEETFPSVTVCNVNAIHCGNLKKVLEIAYCQQLRQQPNSLEMVMLEELLGLDSHKIDCLTNPKEYSFDVIATLIELSTLTDCTMPLGFFYEDLDDELFQMDPYGRLMDERHDLESTFYTLMASLPEEIRLEIGHHFQDFVKECTIKGESCLKRHLWRAFNTPNTGNCFVLNHVSNKEQDASAGKRKSAFPGQFMGLQLVLNLDIDEFIKTPITCSSGALALIQHPQDVLLPTEKSVALMPNTRTVLGMESVHLQRLPYPYPSLCISTWSQTPYHVFPEISNLNYSQMACQRLCFQEEMKQTCGCQHPAFLHQAEERICHIKIGTDDEFDEYKCVVEVMEKFDEGWLNCSSCRPACYETTYKLSYSANVWPSENYWPVAYENYKGQLPMMEEGYDELCENVTAPGLQKKCWKRLEAIEDYHSVEEQVRGDLLRLDIFFQSMSSMIIKEEPKTTPYELFANLGGGLSLVLGMSLAMLFEFVELLVDIAFFLCRKKNE